MNPYPNREHSSVTADWYQYSTILRVQYVKKSLPVYCILYTVCRARYCDQLQPQYGTWIGCVRVLVGDRMVYGHVVLLINDDYFHHI